MFEGGGIDRRELLVAGVAIATAGLLAGTQSATAQSAAPSAKPGRVSVERKNGMILIGLDRPEAHNALDAPMIIGLGKALYALEHEENLHVAVLYGVGADFCVGIDRVAFAAALASGVLPAKDPDIVNPLGLRPPLRSKPMVVAAQGSTKYVGHELFLAADIRVAASDTVFSQGEVARGVFPGGGGTVRFTREAGWGNAMRYMLTGDEWDAAEGRRLGLVQEVTKPDQQLDRAMELAAKVASAAPLGVRATLASAQKALAADEATALAAVLPEFTKLQQSEDSREFVRALQEGRRPSYRGL